jgi:hypothetical protein
VVTCTKNSPAAPNVFPYWEWNRGGIGGGSFERPLLDSPWDIEP